MINLGYVALRLHPAYLFAWFQRFDLTRITSGSSVPQLNKQDLAPLKISLPPLELQEKFAARSNDIDAERSSQRLHFLELDYLFESLQQRAFAGEL